MDAAADIEARARAYAAAQVPALAALASADAGVPAGGGRLVVAVSGGADSVALAALLVEAAGVPAAAMLVAHFEHRLRTPAEGARERAVVEAVCERYGLRLVCGAWEAPARGEAAARGARYAFLARTALDAGASLVAVGHTEDDQVETVLLNTTRGAGAYGQAGMAPERAWPHAGDGRRSGLRLLRPLLGLPRESTRAYCAARALTYIDDPSNDDPAFARNRLRAMLAEARVETAEARAGVLKMAGLARGSIALLEGAAANAVAMSDAEDGRAVVLERAALRALPAELSGYAWHRAVERLLGDTCEFGRRHYAAMQAAARARTGCIFPLPRGVVLTVDPHALLLSVGPLDEPAVAADAAQALPFSGVLGAWRVDARPADAASGGAGGRAPGGDGAVLAAPPNAVLRARRPGDRVALAGSGHKKLQDAYVDAKVPFRHRAAAPVLASGREVLWTPLLALPSRADAGGAAYRIRYSRDAAGAPAG